MPSNRELCKEVDSCPSIIQHRQFRPRKFHSELESWAGYIKDEVRLLTSQTIQEEAQDSTMFRALVTKFSDTESHRRKAALA